MKNEISEIVTRLGLPIAIALLAAGVRLLFGNDRMTPLRVIRAVFVAAFVGSVSAMYLADIESLTEGERGAIIAVVAIIAEDIVLLILKFGKALRDNPSKVISAILTIVRGAK